MIDLIPIYIRFQTVSAVASMYHVQRGHGHCFYVFTSNERYDDALMDALLDYESDVRDAYDFYWVEFRYVPLVLINAISDIIPSSARLMFERDGEGEG